MEILLVIGGIWLLCWIVHKSAKREGSQKAWGIQQEKIKELERQLKKQQGSGCGLLILVVLIAGVFATIVLASL